MSRLVKIAFVSDTHGNQPKIPHCDLLIHCGDLTTAGSMEQIERGLEWFAMCSDARKVFIPGNHDWGFQEAPEETRRMCEDRDIELLINQETTVEGLRIWGSPWTPAFCDWAFNAYPEELEEHWSRIPDGGQIDILVTHGPALGYLDGTAPGPYNDYCSRHVGCPELRRRMPEIRPRVHAFGHTHMQNGVLMVNWPELQYLAVNATVCNERYQCVNPPQVVWL